MKNANQIRHLLKAMVRISNTRPRSVADTVYGDLAAEALALLPCETCNGTGQVPTPQSAGFSPENKIMDTCPDCQQPKRECKNNKACTRYLDGTCLDCPDYK